MHARNLNVNLVTGCSLPLQTTLVYVVGNSLTHRRSHANTFAVAVRRWPVFPVLFPLDGCQDRLSCPGGLIVN